MTLSLTPADLCPRVSVPPKSAQLSSRIIRFATIIVVAALGAAPIRAAWADETTSQPFEIMERGHGPQMVLELFTSQSCSSCPPAERVVHALDSRADVMGIEWHVDYWDDLVAGRRGRWRDPYSDPEHTRRQRGYNERLRATRSVYTPQLVVAGRAELPGFSERKVRRLIDKHNDDLDQFAARVVAAQGAGALRLELDGPAQARRVRVIRIDIERAARTEVKRGENQGKTLENRNIVRSFATIGHWRGGRHGVAFEAQRDDTGRLLPCAILVQEPDLGPVLFGVACPG